MKSKRLHAALALVLMVSVILSCSGFTTAASARNAQLSVNSGTAALASLFQYDTAERSGRYTLDYAYYEPSGTGDYPLVIWLHGLGHGTYPGSQLADNDITKWASREYQSRFIGSNGAYILCPRAAENRRVNWWSSGIDSALMDLIEDFVDEHPNIDTNRIYIGGFSLGGFMTVKMCENYPDYFAAAFPVCPAVNPTITSDSDIAALDDLPMWITACTADPEVPYHIIENFWTKLTDVTSVAGKSRISVLSSVLKSNGIAAASDHKVWEAVTADMFTDSGEDYYNMTTYNGFDTEITLSYPNGMIDWLSRQSK